MDSNSLTQKALGQVGTLGKKLGDVVADETKKTVSTAVGQIGFEQTNSPDVQKKVEHQLSSSSDIKPGQKDTDEFIKQLYAPSQKHDVGDSHGMESPKTDSSYFDKSPEELQKIERLKQELHQQTYYDPTFNRRPQEEERPAEKVEREKIEELQLEQEKNEKKPQPLAVLNAERKIEANRGASG